MIKYKNNYYLLAKVPKDTIMEIRIATVNDAEAISKIYKPYVEKTAVSFEYEAPGVDEMKRRMQSTLEKYPYLVLLEDNTIIGYAYAGAFHSRIAYIHSAELSVYLDMNHRHKGYGRLLYQRLEEILLSQNVYMVHACIASPDEKDEHLTDDSELFHKTMGYKLSARYEKCGYKFGKWYSVVWMDKELVEKPENPADFIPFSKLV